jgi:predicted aminopeptidase
MRKTVSMPIFWLLLWDLAISRPNYRHGLLPGIIALLLLSGCQSAAFYTQATVGQSELLWHSRPIGEVLADPQTPEGIRERLTLVESVRQFAGEVLALPANRSYRRYVDIERDFVMWNVFAAAEFSVEPELFCYPIAGCVGYQGYFKKADAVAFANRLAVQGFEISVGPVAAYSTLGWFADPVVSSVLSYSDTDLAGLVFHELAHERVYIKDDTTFNESFATFVEREGTRRWLASSGQQADIAGFEKIQLQRDIVVDLIHKARAELGALYVRGLGVEEMRWRKLAVFDQLQADYNEMRRAGDANDWGNWFDDNLNNAKLTSIGVYHDRVEFFEQLFERSNRNFEVFYRLVEQLGSLPLED